MELAAVAQANARGDSKPKPASKPKQQAVVGTDRGLIDQVQVPREKCPQHTDSPTLASVAEHNGNTVQQHAALYHDDA